MTYTLGVANPFAYQGPIAPSRLIDRAEGLDSLQRAAADRVAVRLTAPRRFGKTSLLDAHVEAMRAAGHRAVRVDFSKVATVGDMCGRLSRAFSDLPADPQQVLARLLVRLGITLGPSGVTVRYSGSGSRDISLDSQEARHALAELLDLPAALHRADGEMTIVCFDEFQDLLVADGEIDGLVRSVIQHHGDAAAYVYAGSEPSLMQALFEGRERPLYGQARPLQLPALSPAEAVREIGEALNAEGLPVTGAIAQLVTLAEGHPQRTMLLAHHLFNVLSEDDGHTAPAAVAVDLALAETADGLQAVWDGFDRPERIVALALAEGQAPTGTRVAQEHRLARSTLQAALDRLVKAQQHVVRRDEHPVLLDPLLGEWLRRR